MANAATTFRRDSINGMESPGQGGVGGGSTKNAGILGSGWGRRKTGRRRPGGDSLWWWRRLAAGAGDGGGGGILTARQLVYVVGSCRRVAGGRWRVVWMHCRCETWGGVEQARLSLARQWVRRGPSPFWPPSSAVYGNPCSQEPDSKGHLCGSVVLPCSSAARRTRVSSACPSTARNCLDHMRLLVLLLTK